MATAATRAKRKYNEAHYARVQITIDKEIVTRYKEYCKEKGVSVASDLTKYMRETVAGHETAGEETEA